MSRKFHSVHPGSGDGPESPEAPRPSPLLAALIVSTFATAASLGLPEEHASSAVALVFLFGTYIFCLRRGHRPRPEAYGLCLGGLMEERALSPRRIFGETLQAWLVATGVASVVLPAFWLGFVWWYAPDGAFDIARAFSWEGESNAGLWLREMVLWHLIAVALPEEAFFRGYLQSEFDLRGGKSIRIGGVPFGVSIVLVSAIFALGHFATEPHPARLAVFFPSLLFGVVRNASGGVGAAIFLHAECNLFSQWLGQGYGLY